MVDTEIITDEHLAKNYIETSEEVDSLKNDRSLQLNNKRVLVVEDSKDSRDLICHLLKKVGAKVESASNGKEGLEKVKSYKPDLLLLDLEMPVMDGFGVIKKLRAEEYRKPIVAITAHNTIQDRDRCQDAGFDGLISKPFNDENLLRVLKEHLSSV